MNQVTFGNGATRGRRIPDSEDKLISKAMTSAAMASITPKGMGTTSATPPPATPVKTKGLKPTGGTVQGAASGGVGKALNESQSRRLFQVGARMNRGKVGQREEMAINGRRHFQNKIDNRWETAYARASKDGTHKNGSKNLGLPRAARKRGVNNEQMSNELNRRAIGTRKPETYFSRTNVFKAYRSWDPESARVHRQSMAQGGLAAGGVALAASGASAPKKLTPLKGAERLLNSSTRLRIHEPHDSAVPNGPHVDRNFKDAKGKTVHGITEAERTMLSGTKKMTGSAKGRIALGAAALGGAAGLRRFTNDKANRQYY